MKKTVLIVEDEPHIVLGIQDALEFEGFRVVSAGRGKEGIALARAENPDAIILDLMLPDTNGYAVCEELRRWNASVPIVMLTARSQETDKIRGLDAGADDYLIKPYDPGELLARLRAVERRRSTASAPVVALGDLEIDLSRELVRRRGVPVALTQKEWSLLRVMATRPDRIHTRENLQDALYGFDDEADSNTLEVFVSRLRRKLGRDHIQTLRGLGYRLVHAAGDGD